MKRAFLLALVLLIVLFQISIYAVGTATVTVANIGVGLTRYTIDWLSDAGGAVSGNAFTVMPGYLVAIEFVPDSGGTAPDDLYDITLIDEASVDVLDGQAANLSQTAGLIILFDPPLPHDPDQNLDLVVAAAGAANGGLVYLYVR